MFVMSGIVDFAVAAFPWVAMGLLLAAFFVIRSRQKKDPDKSESYYSEGMCLGLCLGVALAPAFHINTGIGIALGMLFGLVIGSCIPREDD